MRDRHMPSASIDVPASLGMEIAVGLLVAFESHPAPLFLVSFALLGLYFGQVEHTRLRTTPLRDEELGMFQSIKHRGHLATLQLFDCNPGISSQFLKEFGELDRKST